MHIEDCTAGAHDSLAKEPMQRNLMSGKHPLDLSGLPSGREAFQP
jgi:hypothetical protein